MVIEKVHGLHATSISLNDRFTILATAEPARLPMRQKRRASFNNFVSQNVNFRNQALIEQIARKLEQQARRKALRQRLGIGSGGLRKFGSEGHLSGLQRSNSFGNLSQGRSVKARVGWKQSNGNLSRSASFSNLSGASRGGRTMRGFRKRGGAQRVLRFRFRGGRQGVGRMNRVQQRPRPGVLNGGGPSTRGQGIRGQTTRGQGITGQTTRGQGIGGQTTRGQGIRGQTMRGQSTRGRGRGGGTLRPQPPKTMFTKEELDAQLEQYMAGTKAALDKELDVYMQNALEMQ